MERLTRPNINVDPDTDRFLHAAIGGKEIDWKQNRDSTLNVLINGPTSNGFGKDIFRKMARDLYGRLKAYEDSGCEPEEVLPKGKAGEIALNLMRLAGLESLCSYDRLRELAEADKDGRCMHTGLRTETHRSAQTAAKNMSGMSTVPVSAIPVARRWMEVQNNAKSV